MTAVSGNGTYPSGSFVAPAPGTYRWEASYSGDPIKAAAGPTACSDPAEAVVVTGFTAAIPTLSSWGLIAMALAVDSRNCSFQKAEGNEPIVGVASFNKSRRHSPISTWSGPSPQLLHREISGLGSFENLVHEVSGSLTDPSRCPAGGAASRPARDVPGPCG